LPAGLSEPVPRRVLAADERVNDAFNQKDVGAVMAMVTPDIVFENTSGRRFVRELGLTLPGS